MHRVRNTVFRQSALRPTYKPCKLRRRFAFSFVQMGTLFGTLEPCCLAKCTKRAPSASSGPRFSSWAPGPYRYRLQRKGRRNCAGMVRRTLGHNLRMGSLHCANCPNGPHKKAEPVSLILHPFLRASGTQRQRMQKTCGNCSGNSLASETILTPNKTYHYATVLTIMLRPIVWVGSRNWKGDPNRAKRLAVYM